MAIEPKYYRVTINQMTGAAEKAGFIDHRTLEEYINNGNGTFPASLASAENKARGNLRYLRLINLLEENATPSLITEINNGGATVDTEGTSFEFTIVYERPDYIYTYNELFGTGHSSGNIKILTNEDAIRRIVARVFVEDFISNWRYPYDPSTSNLGYHWIDKSVKAESPLSGTLEARITAAEANVTVVEIPNT